MGSISAVDLQSKIAQGLVDAMPEPWERLVVNLEAETTAEGPVLDYMFFYISRTVDGDFRTTSVRMLPDSVRDDFIALHDALFESSGDRWGICDLVIDCSTGRHDFQFKYEPPKRLNDVFDESSMWRFDSYLDTYRAERAAEKGA